MKKTLLSLCAALTTLAAVAQTTPTAPAATSTTTTTTTDKTMTRPGGKHPMKARHHGDHKTMSKSKTTTVK
jgi:hypothetical protein